MQKFGGKDGCCCICRDKDVTFNTSSQTVFGPIDTSGIDGDGWDVHRVSNGSFELACVSNHHNTPLFNTAPNDNTGAVKCINLKTGAILSSNQTISSPLAGQNQLVQTTNYSSLVVVDNSKFYGTLIDSTGTGTGSPYVFCSQFDPNTNSFVDCEGNGWNSTTNVKLIDGAADLRVRGFSSLRRTSNNLLFGVYNFTPSFDSAGFAIKVFCYDLDNDALCANNSLNLDITGAGVQSNITLLGSNGASSGFVTYISNTEAADGKARVFYQDRALGYAWCFKPISSSIETCDGWPATGVQTGPLVTQPGSGFISGLIANSTLFPRRNPNTGLVTGVCNPGNLGTGASYDGAVDPQCFDLNGNAVNTPADQAFVAAFNAKKFHNNQGGAMRDLGTRIFWTTRENNIFDGNFILTCFDWSAPNRACSGFADSSYVVSTGPGIPYTNPYAIVQSQIPGEEHCMWINWDRGGFFSFDANTGETPCSRVNQFVVNIPINVCKLRSFGIDSIVPSPGSQPISATDFELSIINNNGTDLLFGPKLLNPNPLNLSSVQVPSKGLTNGQLILELPSIPSVAAGTPPPSYDITGTLQYCSRTR